MPAPTQAQDFGFQYVGPQNPTVIRVNLIAANTAIGIGDALHLEATGEVDQADASDENIFGVALEAKDASDGGDIACIAATPSTLFAVRLGGTPGQTVVGNNADITVAARDSNTLQSRMGLNSSTAATTAQFKIHGLHGLQGNAWGDEEVVVVGAFFESVWNTGGTVGI